MSSSGISGSLRNITIDDSDASLRYSQGWQGILQTQAVGGGYQFTTGDGDGVELVLPPNAVAVYYYGFKQPLGAFYGACVDCVSNSTGTLFDTIDGHESSEADEQSSSLLYSMENLDPTTNHTLALINFPDTRFSNNSSELTLDAFVVTVVDSQSAAPSSTTSQSSPTSSVSASPVHLDAAFGGRLPLAGGIIAIVLVSTFILSMVALALTCWIRRRRRRVKKSFVEIQQISYPITTNLPTKREDLLQDLLPQSGVASLADRYPSFFPGKGKAPEHPLSRPSSAALADRYPTIFTGTGNIPEKPSAPPRLSIKLTERASRFFSRKSKDVEKQAESRPSSRTLAERASQFFSVAGWDSQIFIGSRPDSMSLAERASQFFTGKGKEPENPVLAALAAQRANRNSNHRASISSWGSSQMGRDRSSLVIVVKSPTTARPLPTPPLHMPRRDEKWELV